MGTLSTVRNIYHRGSLEYCNYTCSYCSLGGKSASAGTDGDQEALHHFVSHISRWKHGTLRILIIPYGEAMIYRYYRESIIRLTTMPHVAGVSCQTNLSFSVSRFLNEVKEARTDITKIKFWGNYHPKMADVTDSAPRIEKLHAAGIEAYAGVVGDPSAEEQIQRLRLLLNPSVCLFVNAMQGLRKPLSKEDVRFFSEMDNLFDYDQRNARACLSNCSRDRKSLFVDREGGMHACPRNGVQTEDFCDDSASLFQPSCLHKVCGRYITFSNLRDTPLKKVVGEGALWHILGRKKVRAVFLDIGGILTGVQGRIPGRIVSALKYMFSRLSLYLSTASPMAHTKKRFGDVFDLFPGGVFTDEDSLYYEDAIECVPVGHPMALDFPGCRIICYTWEREISKYVVSASIVQEATRLLTGLEGEAYQLYQEGRLLTVVNSRAGRKNGLMTLCSRLEISPREILVVGNTMRNWPMMSAAGYSCAMMSTEEELRKLSGYISNPDGTPVFFDI